METIMFPTYKNIYLPARRCSSVHERLVSERCTSSSGRSRLKFTPLRMKSKPGVARAATESGEQVPETTEQIISTEDRPQPVNGFSGGSSYTLDFASASSQGNMGTEVQVLAAAVATAASDEQTDERYKAVDRLLNATLVGAAAAYAITKIATVDQDYWHGWTFYEIIKYAPMHNWSAYEEALKSHPVLAKMMISGIVYSIGDWMAQCYEGKPVLDFNRTRMLRSGLVGFCLHGSLSHFYYHFCEALFPFHEWWVVPLKVGFDQTIWSAFWNSVYFITIGFLRFENPVTIFTELRATFFPLLTAGWKLWPFAHLITYGLVPVEQRLLWVDMVELVWVTILSMYSNEKAEARILEDTTTTSS